MTGMEMIEQLLEPDAIELATVLEELRWIAEHLQEMHADFIERGLE